MLEILLVVGISKKIVAMMKEKGRNPVGYVILFIALWFGGEIMGAVVGTIAAIAMDPNAIDGGFNCTAYIFALIGAGIGAAIGYAVAASVPPVDQPQWPQEDFRDRLNDDDDLDDEASRERRRRRRDADDGSFEEPTR